MSHSILRELLLQLMYNQLSELRQYLQALVELVLISDSWNNARIKMAFAGTRIFFSSITVFRF